MATNDNKIGFINGFTQGGLFVGAQTANAVKTGIAGLAENLHWLSTLYEALSRTLITFAALTVVIENILNFKKIIDMKLSAQEADEAEKNKTYVRTAIGVIKIGVVGLFVPLTFGVIAGAAILAAAIAFPVMIGLEVLYGLGEFIYDSLNIAHKEAVFEEKKQDYRAIMRDDTATTHAKRMAKLDAQKAFVEQEAAKENFQYQRNGLLAKAVILAGAIMAIFPPTMLAGFAIAAAGFAGVTKIGVDQTGVALKKEGKLNRLAQQEEALRVRQEAHVVADNPLQPLLQAAPTHAINFAARDGEPAAASNKAPGVLSFFGHAVDTARRTMYTALPARLTR